jgi:hypothetical protein
LSYTRERSPSDRRIRVARGSWAIVRVGGLGVGVRVSLRTLTTLTTLCRLSWISDLS